MSIRTHTHPARFQASVHPGLKLEDEIEIDEQHRLLHEAGQIAAKVRDTISKMVKPGISVLDLCIKADELIDKANAKPAFPINISINEAAAHYTSPPIDQLIIPQSGVVKVDVGVHLNGFIADTAESIDLDGSFTDLIKCTVDSTEIGIKVIRPGSMTGNIGGIIEKTIRDAGFEPIRELSGHLVERFVVHAGKTVPCVGEFKGDLVEEGEVYAIETFASTGQGSVHADFNKITIFRAAPIKVKLRNKNARKVIKAAIHDFGGMPFAERWLESVGLTRSQASIGLKELQRMGGVVEYHVLRAATPDAMVSQHEHTMIVKEDGAEVTTRLV